MNTKDTVILLIFLLAILGLLAGAYCTEHADVKKAPENSVEKIYEDENGVITITLEPKEKENNVIKYLSNFKKNS